MSITKDPIFKSIMFALAVGYIALISQSVFAAEANPSDLAQASKFLVNLPPACSGSSKYVDAGGAVNIRVVCDGNGKKMDGLVVIKNGVVTQIR